MRQRFSLPYEENQIIDILTASMIAEVRYRGGEYVSTPGIEKAIEVTAAWLHGGGKTGMLYCGRCGNGKTTLMRAVMTLTGYVAAIDIDGTPMSLRYTTARDIAHCSISEQGTYERLCKCPMLAIDDLGTEPTEVLDYGNVTNPAIDLLSRRYDEQLFTMISTNLAPKEIREKYGDRIADRFNEMFARVVFNEKSFRV